MLWSKHGSSNAPFAISRTTSFVRSLRCFWNRVLHKRASKPRKNNQRSGKYGARIFEDPHPLDDSFVPRSGFTVSTEHTLLNKNNTHQAMSITFERRFKGCSHVQPTGHNKRRPSRSHHCLLWPPGSSHPAVLVTAVARSGSQKARTWVQTCAKSPSAPSCACAPPAPLTLPFWSLDS
jgi:hypothetical protein